jgi:hypothetical protein
MKFPERLWIMQTRPPSLWRLRQPFLWPGHNAQKAEDIQETHYLKFATYGRQLK